MGMGSRHQLGRNTLASAGLIQGIHQVFVVIRAVPVGGCVEWCGLLLARYHGAGLPFRALTGQPITSQYHRQGNTGNSRFISSV